MLRSFKVIQNIRKVLYSTSQVIPAFKSKSEKENSSSDTKFRFMAAGTLAMALFINSGMSSEAKKKAEYHVKEDDETEYAREVRLQRELIKGFKYRNLESFFNVENKFGIGILFDNKDQLHREFIKELRPALQDMKDTYPNLIISKNQFRGTEIENERLDMMFFTLEEISRKNRPAVFLKVDNALFKIKSSHLQEKYNKVKLADWIKGKTTFEKIQSRRDLADILQKYNKKYHDNVIVFYVPKEKQTAFFKDLTNQRAVNLMRHESVRMVLIDDAKLAEELTIKEDKYYCYYKPSFCNGFEDFEIRDINMEYLQVLENVCRDEFWLNKGYMHSDELLHLSSTYHHLWDPDFMDMIFDNCFHRSYNVEFILNTDVKRSMKELEAKPKPIVFVYFSEMFMKMQQGSVIGELKNIVRAFDDKFEFLFTNNPKVASKYFYMKSEPDIFPFVIIIDPKTKIPVPADDMKAVEKGNFYYAKYTQRMDPMSFTPNMTEFLGKYISNDLKEDYHFQSQKPSQETRVKSIAMANFEEEIINNPKVEQCIVEVHKHNCNSCFFNGKTFNVLSRKLGKHGLSKELPLFRINIDNKVPYLGNFFYSPIYYYMRKRDGKLVELHLIESPNLSPEKFVKKVGELSKLDLSKIKIDSREHMMKYFNHEDKVDDFDIDFDVPIAIAKERLKEEEEQKKSQAPEPDQASAGNKNEDKNS